MAGPLFLRGLASFRPASPLLLDVSNNLNNQGRASIEPQKGCQVKKSKAETEQTRRRIVAAAADEVRRKGLADANMGEVMSAAGLTHGGFYRHFSNREQLFEEGLKQAMAASGKLMADRAAAGGISNAIDGYLSAQHRDEDVPRCPYAAMGSELARHPTLKAEAWAGVSVQIATLAHSIGDDEGANDRATVIFALMMGAMTLSRMATDEDRSDSILALARRESLAIARVVATESG
jgi:TetR/AcrR family transcriptional regulator, transcriptional repressor for nem operon